MEYQQSHLFLYTKPENQVLFEGCGFHRLVSVLNAACLMENTPVGIRDYCDTLAAFRQPGKRIGSIVMNANPFTLGHRHLVLQALKQCDWLHVFVVAEDVSTIAYADRLELVRAGLKGMDRVTVHGGSRYLISKATFPAYFIKDSRVVEACSMAVDLLLFRNYIAPALGITHRFVGSEPFCPVTRKYNQDLHEWLERAPEKAPAVHVVEFPRLEINGRPISATDVRQLLAVGDFKTIASLAPATTIALLHEKYAARGAARNAAQPVEV
jgi:[citrate (pro-3S)-lyase] ligase